MRKQTRYWLYGGIAAVLLIIIIVWMNASSRRNNTTPDSTTNKTPDTQQALPPSTENTLPGTENAVTDTQQNTLPSTENTEKDNLTAYLAEQDEIMTAMMKNMEVVPSGNAAIDFLVGMIPHHESAIQMSESYLKHGAFNTDLKKLAEDIISAQTAEIEEMKTLITEIEKSGEKDTTKEEGYLKAYDEMMASHTHMGHGTSTGNNVDMAFAEGMIMHHQMAVDMAKAVLDYTDNEKVRTLAQNIIDLQDVEIQKMQGLLTQ